MHKAARRAKLAENFALFPETAHILVVGLGATGMSVARYLQSLGFKFAMADSRSTPEQLAELAKQWPNVELFIGPFDAAILSNITHMVVSPGISLKQAFITQALAQGITALSDIDLFVSAVDVPIIAITGSNGKSTVTTMVGDILDDLGIKAGVGGNLGIPALDLLAEDNQMYVLELSSFQLERTSLLNAAAATVLNVTPDHLDRHSDMTEYAFEKQKIFQGDGVMVINLDDPIVANMQVSSRQTISFSTEKVADFYLEFQQDIEYLVHKGIALMPVAALPLEGRHNTANALAALALGSALELDCQIMCNSLQKFNGLAHRMQRVAEINGITWVNDSKATNIGACIAALQGYDHKVILIAGGDAKGADMTELAPVVKAKAKSVVLMGKDAGLIAEALQDCVPIIRVNTMIEAVQTAANCAEAGDSVLLSPACASLDQYKNYQDRGEQFAHAVKALRG